VGRSFSEAEERLGDDVALLGARVADSIANTIGYLPEEVRVGGREHRVIGVVETGVSAYIDFDAAVVLPMRRASRMGENAAVERALLVSLPDPSPGSDDRAELVGALRQVARIRPDAQLRLDVMGYAEMRADLDALSRRVRLLLMQLSMILATASSVGIGALQTSHARTRLKEFGVKRALGARRADIVLEGVRSSLQTTGAGVLGGVVLALLIAVVTARAFGSEVAAVLPSVALGGIPSMVGGVLSGALAYWGVAKRSPAELLGHVG